jgi:alpha-glucuronidase
MNLSEEKTTMAIAANEVREYWHGEQAVLFNVLDTKDEILGPEGYRLVFGKDAVAVDANTETGILYGTYDLLRRQETGKVLKEGTVTEVPAYQYRVLNHWDNPDLTVERGYAGQSLWKWEGLPETVLPVYEEYARANASLGINCTVLNNVNADPVMLTPARTASSRPRAQAFRSWPLTPDSRMHRKVLFWQPSLLTAMQPVRSRVRKCGKQSGVRA